MEREDIGGALRNLDQRMDRVEQFLPTLATKDEFQTAVAKLATKDEFQTAVAKLATKDELQTAVAKLATKEELQTAVAKLATKEELQDAVAKLATKDELRQAKEDLEEKITAEGATSRLYMKVLMEEVKTEIGLFGEKFGALDRRDARQHADTIKRETLLDPSAGSGSPRASSRGDKRVTALEAARSKPRG